MPEPTTTTTRTKTLYHILREISHNGGRAYEPVSANVEATSSEHALRTWADTANDAPDGQYVAVPARSFKPTLVTFETKTVAKVGGPA